MTVPHDEQPLTRRALRELERQKPRKQQKEDAKAADNAEAQRLAVAEAVARSADPIGEVAAVSVVTDPVVAPPVVTPPAAPTDAGPTIGGPTNAGPNAADAPPVAEPSSSTTMTEAPVSAAKPVLPEPSTASSAVPFAPSATPATPALSRRARRALSADHPFADQQAVDSHLPGHPTPEQHFTEARADTTGPATTTGPIIAEIIPDEPTPTDAIEVLETGAVDTQKADASATDAAGSDRKDASSDTSEVAVPVIEELIVVDGTVDPAVANQEEEEFAEIDDTVAPEAVHIITIDENPSGPILPPLVTPPAGRAVSHSDQYPSAFDNLIASRGVGASNSVTSTSALVLPSVPNHGDVGTALDETGEVIITGSIDLPMSLGSTGAAPADGLESSELDAYLDPDGDIGSDVAPVSATRAVSTHGSNSGLIAPPKRSRANAPVILAVTAGVLAVAVIGLIVAAVVFRIF